MSKIKIFLLVVFILLIVAIGASGYVWFKLQNVGGAVPASEQVEETTALKVRVKPEATPVANSIPDEGLKVDTSAISDEQKAAAEKIGIDLDTTTITPEMVSCAELKLGSSRIEELLNGSTPSALESVSIIGCL
ncbi:MAG: hypothetical protein ACI92I_000415 [Acidimicrobiales bacterium]|jgi:hypothetical protein